MASFPTSIRTWTTILSGDNRNSPSLAGRLNELADELRATQLNIATGAKGTFASVKARLDFVQGKVDQTTITTGAVAAGGFTVTTLWASKIGDMMSLAIYATYESGPSDITVPASGNITNTLVATLPVSMRGNHGTDQALTSLIGGRGAFGTYDAATGEVYINSVAGSGDIEIGDAISLGGMVILNT